MRKSGRVRRAATAARTSATRTTGSGAAVQAITMSTSAITAADLLEWHRGAGQGRRQLAGAGRRAVGDVERHRALLHEEARGQLRHLARAHQQHRLAVQAAEDLPRQLHRGGGDGHREAAHLRLRAHALGHAEGLAHEGVEHGAHGAARLRQREGILHLPQDLRLADHQRVQARRHPEGVTHRLLAGMREEVGLDGPERDAAMRPQLAEGGRPRLAGRLRHAVDLHPVAGGEDHELRRGALRGERGHHLAQLVLLEGELLAHLHRRRPVTHPRHEERRWS